MGYCVCVRACVCARARARECLFACMHEYVRLSSRTIIKKRFTKTIAFHGYHYITMILLNQLRISENIVLRICRFMYLS